MAIKHPEDLLTVFRANRREALVVFQGGSAHGYQPVTNIDGQIRVAYLNADGTEPAFRTAEYGWASPRGLRRVRRLPE